MTAHYLRERGNVLFLILLAVVLFAALSYAVTNSMRGGGKDATPEKLEMQASEILQYATNIENVVTRLRLSQNCRDTQISFENTTVSGYANAGAPSTKNCHVFDQAGGGLSYQSPPAGSGASEYYFSTELVNGIGTSASYSDGADLLILVPNLTLELCTLINNKIDPRVTTSIMIEDSAINLTTNKFTGTYSSSADIDSSFWNFNGVASPEGCRQNTSSGAHYYFKVLLPR